MTDVTTPLHWLFSDFATAFCALLSEATFRRIFAQHGPRGGGQCKLAPWQWVLARVYHELAPSGSFSQSVKTTTGMKISDSALSQRARSLGWELLMALLPVVLRPLAELCLHPGAFHRGLRLLAVDGTRFNLRNTSAIQARAKKVACSKGGGVPAFAHLLAVVLLELGLHQPLGASLGWRGEGELTLARELFARQGLPERCLLLADRLFGVPALLWELKPLLEASGSAVLVRVKSNLKVTRVRQLADGSWLVRVTVRDPLTRRKLGTLELREIGAQIQTQNHARPQTLRLWTSLLDCHQHPAAELAELYARRWEQELFFRELKSQLHGRDNLLDAQTPETAAQEVLAMLLAASLIARQRQAVAEHAQVDILRISFAKVLRKTNALCEILALAGNLLPSKAQATLTERVLDELQTSALIQKRKPRSCPRSVRQPTKDWPKTKKASSQPLIKTIVIANP